LRRALLITGKSGTQKTGKRNKNLLFHFSSPDFNSTVIEVVVATRNAHKTREIREILGPDFAVRDLTGLQMTEIRETGASFKENATLKALAISKVLSGLIVADDSGLEVKALNGAPGIYSARYGGATATEQANIDKLLRELARVRIGDNTRRARFCCVVALAQNGCLVGMFEGIVNGTICDEPRGDHGFGYDPIFVPQGFKQTFGELPDEVKNSISHRAKAVRRLAVRLRQLQSRD
jgi:XTP/dITP diphosphohydrolase